jgi:hypothetical protein
MTLITGLPVFTGPFGVDMLSVPPLEVRVAFALLALGVLLVLGLIVWAVRSAERERVRLRCPLYVGMATIVFRRAPDGSREDVLRCSRLRRGRAITCTKACLQLPQAA